MLRPFGYQNASVCDPVEAPIVREIAERVLAGESLESVARLLKDRDIHTTMGNYFQGTTIKQMLLNPRLAGLRRTDSGLMPSTVEPILTRGEHELLVKLLTDKSRNSGTPTSQSVVYVLAGLAVCGNCGNTLVSRKNANRRTYVCSSGAPYFGCGGVRIVAEPLENEIAERVIGRLVAKQSVAGVEAAKQHAIEQADAAPELIAEANRKLSVLAQEYAAGRINRSQLADGSKPLKQEIAAARRVERLGEAVRGLPPVESVAGWVEFWEQGTPEKRRMLLSLFVERVVVGPVIRKGSKIFDPDRATVEWRR